MQYKLAINRVIAAPNSKIESIQTSIMTTSLISLFMPNLMAYCNINNHRMAQETKQQLEIMTGLKRTASIT